MIVDNKERIESSPRRGETKNRCCFFLLPPIFHFLPFHHYSNIPTHTEMTDVMPSHLLHISKRSLINCSETQENVHFPMAKKLRNEQMQCESMTFDQPPKIGNMTKKSRFGTELSEAPQPIRFQNLQNKVRGDAQENLMEAIRANFQLEIQKSQQEISQLRASLLQSESTNRVLNEDSKILKKAVTVRVLPIG